MANNVVIYCIVNYKFEYNFKFYNNKLYENFIYLSFMYGMCFVFQ